MTVVQISPLAKSLADFDLDDDAIAKIVQHAHNERMRIKTDFAPSNGRGSTFYNWMVSGVREHLITRRAGWSKKNVNGLEVVENAEKRVRIAYLSAEGTDTERMTSSPRGSVSIAAAANNGTISLLASHWLQPTRTKDVAAIIRGLKSTFETWFLAIEKVGDHYQVVLALPKKPDGDRFVEWECRIRVADVPLDSEPKTGALPPPPPAETTAPPKAKRKKKPGNSGSGSSEATG